MIRSSHSSNVKQALCIKAPRANSKQALIVEMLSKEAGATIGALTDATGWLPHTTRAALTGLRKRGFPIERVQKCGSAAGSLYRIASHSSASRRV